MPVPYGLFRSNHLACRGDLHCRIVADRGGPGPADADVTLTAGTDQPARLDTSAQVHDACTDLVSARAPQTAIASGGEQRADQRRRNGQQGQSRTETTQI